MTDLLRVEAEVTVRTDPEAAFSAFTAGLSTWWPTAWSWGPDDLDRHELEPRDGGRVTEFHADGYQLDWGRVTEWNPPTRLVLDWAVGPDRVPCPDTPSRLTVLFLVDGASTRVALVHDRLEAHGEGAAAYAEALGSEEGWSWALRRFAAPLRPE